MKQQLKYSKNAVIKDFVTNMDYGNNAHLNAQNPFNENFAPDNRYLSQYTIDSIKNQQDFLFCLSNNCRDNFVPEFADETKYFPVSADSINASVTLGNTNPADDNITTIATLPDVSELTTPPNTKEDSAVLNSILIGAGVFILLNLFSE